MRISALVAMILMVVMVGCVTPHRSVVVDIDPQYWGTAEISEIKNSDTTSLVDINIFMRFRRDIISDTIPLNIKTTAPDSAIYSEDFTIYPTDPQTIEQRDNMALIPYRRRCQLSQVGIYRFSLRPYKAVVGAECIGITIIDNKE